MTDLLDVLRTARDHYAFRSQDDFASFLYSLRQDASGMSVAWDDGAGEEWARGYNAEMSFLIHCSVGIAFVRFKREPFCIPSAFSHLTVVPVSSFDAEEWFLDIDLLSESMPELSWHTSADIVNPSAFSLNDLYYATV